MSVVDFVSTFSRMHLKTRAKVVSYLLNAGLIHTAKGDWRAYLKQRHARSVGVSRMILQTVLNYTDEQFERFLEAL
jgi:hypothetical protein